MRQQELEKQLEQATIKLKKIYNEGLSRGFWAGLLMGMILGVILMSISCEPPQCYSCRIVTDWPEIGQSYDTTIIICDPLGGIENFERNNTYIDTVLSDFDTYQTCDCK